MFISCSIIAVYAISYFSPLSIIPDFQISSMSLAFAVVSLFAGLIMRFWAPHDHLRELATLIYILGLVSVGSLVAFSGNPITPFVALLAGAIIFSCYFGIAGALAALLVIVGVNLWQLGQGQQVIVIIQIAAVLGIVPFITSILLWSKNASSTVEDTTEDKSYHELATQLSQVAGKSEVVINAIADGVLALNSKGQIELINPAAQRIIGWGKQDALGLSYKSVLKLMDAKNAEVQDINSPIEKALQENKAYDSDIYSLVTSSGKNILTSIVASPIGQAGSGVIVVFRDITSEKAEERQQAEFISTASHEMRTPVASIEGYLGLALNPNTAQIDEKARDFINKAHASAQHLGRLFQDLLDVSKADDGRLANNPTVVDVVPYLAEIATGLKPKADEKGLHFIYKPIPDNAPARDHLTARTMTPVFYANVDNDHLREIVANLIENAIKYTPSGDVTVDVSGDDTSITISVADTGLGIPKEDQAHLFQKFYRVDSSDTREIGGTGLGLYLCRRLAETIGGSLWVESEYKRGSVFFLKLPRISHEDATHLIEQASIEAERRAAQEASRAPEPAPEAPTQITLPQAPVAAPIAPLTPAPVQQVPQVQAPQLQPQEYTQPMAPAAPIAQPVAAQQAAPQLVNVPLSAIEANPRQYMQPRDSNVSVPERRA